MALFTSHNTEAHIQWWNELDAKVCLRSETRLILKAFLYDYEIHARIMGEDRGFWHASEAHIAAIVGCNPRTIRSLFSSLKSSNILSIKSSNSGSKVKVNDYEKLYGIQKEKSSNKTSNESSTKSSPNRQQNRIEEGLIEEKREETLTPLSETSSDLFGKAEAEKSEPKPRAKKEPADPRLNAGIFIKRVMDSNPGFILGNGQMIGKRIKAILQELAKGPDGPQETLWAFWLKFRSKTIIPPGNYPMTGRAYDLDAFTHTPVFNLLREKVAGNGSAAQDQTSEPHIPSKNPYTRWAQIREYYPNASKDPDQEYPFSLTDEAVQAEVNPFKPISLKGRGK